MRRLIALGAALLALTLGPAPAAAQALTPQTVAVLSGPNPCAGVPFKADFIAGAYCLQGVRYASLAAMPGYSFTRSGNEYCQRLDLTWVQVGPNVLCVTDKGFSSWEGRTNLLLRSQAFDNASWTKTDMTVTADQAMAPDQTTTADLLTEGSAGTSNTTQSVTVTASTNTYGSVFLKRGNTDWVRVRLVGTATNAINGWVNLATCAAGTVTNAGSATAGALAVTQEANGFCRAVLSGVVSTDTSVGFAVFSAAADASTSRVSGATYYAWQADMNSNVSFATPPVLSGNATTARGIGSLQITGVSGILALPVSLVASWSIGNMDGVDSRPLSINDGSANNRVEMQRNITNFAGYFIVSGGAQQTVPANAAGKTGARTIKGAGRIKAAGQASAWDGAVTTYGGAFTAPTGVDRIYLGWSAAGTRTNGFVRSAAIYGDLTNAQLQNLTQ